MYMQNPRKLLKASHEIPRNTSLYGSQCKTQPNVEDHSIGLNELINGVLSILAMLESHFLSLQRGRRRHLVKLDRDSAILVTVEVVAADLNTRTVHINFILLAEGRASVLAPIIRGATERRAAVAVVRLLIYYNVTSIRSLGPGMATRGSRGASNGERDDGEDLSEMHDCCFFVQG
jgi:hypothetical protein